MSYNRATGGLKSEIKFSEVSEKFIQQRKISFPFYIFIQKESFHSWVTQLGLINGAFVVCEIFVPETW